MHCHSIFWFNIGGKKTFTSFDENERYLSGGYIGITSFLGFRLREVAMKNDGRVAFYGLSRTLRKKEWKKAKSS